jgi:DNA-directed RNA polymerase subunit M/transcription elongation factor TFIIS
MKFCSGCNNMFYVKINDEELVYYCRNCGNEDNTLSQNYIASKTNILNEDTVYSNIINKYTKYDHTLPKVDGIICINSECISHENNKQNILLIRNDESNMKYIYLCGVCDHVWKSNIK